MADALLDSPRADLPMEVCDAEWQWDRRKLTFYYTADTRVDFRELVRELFRVYKTRVWM
jgi:cell fate regulator YaaT (PSP1 superfamily)